MDIQERKLSEQPLIDVVIPNYNGIAYLETCLASLARQSYSNIRIIVVDNGSSDGSAVFIRTNFPDTSLVLLDENKGFSAAVNIGIKTGESPMVFLLNNDTELAPDCLEELVQAAAEHDDAFFAPKMLSYRERHLLDGAGEGFLRGGVGYRLGTMEPDNPVYGESRQVFGACGGAALYRRSMLRQTGLFDEDFFAYLEDVDLNFRANRAGFTCRYVPSALVYHIGSATSGSRINPFTIRLSTRNNLYLLLKNYPVSFFLRFMPAIIVYQFFWFIFVVKKRQFRAYISGLINFFQNLSAVLKKRRYIQSTAAGITNSELADRILGSERSVIHSIKRRRGIQGKGNLFLQLYEKLFL